jgi:beta-glucosidase
MFGSHLVEAVRAGKLETSVLDRAVRRVLTLKFRLGLFDKPYVNAERAEQVIGQTEHIRLARQLATEGLVLLKNVDGILPLPKTSKRIAVIGPNADQVYNQLGDYTSPQPRSRVITVLDGIRGKLGKDQTGVLYAPGCRIKGESREGFENALACATEADTVVMVVGGSSARDFGEGTIDLKTGASKVSDRDWNDMESGEGIDRMTLGLAGVQLQLMQEVYRLGKELVVVYMNGRPIAEPWVEEHAHAIVEAWYPGQEGGHAIADILFGDVNPSGRLTLSIPKHVGQLPVYYNGKRSRGKRYLEDDAEPRYPFGYGLSYTTFSYERLTLSANSIRADESVTVAVDVTNTGEREGAEVVQLYISDTVSSVTRPIRELKGFCKVVLKPGETRTVEFVVGSGKLQYIGRDLKPVVEAGRFSIEVGRHSKDTLGAELIVREDE